MATLTLTLWERTQLENVHLLLEQARTAIRDLEEKERALRSGRDVDASRDWLTFRSITFDLYTVLDYTFFLLHCHFYNKGQPDFSRKANHLGFPSKPSGVKTSQTDAHDQKKKFVREKMQSLWRSKLGEDTHFWQEIGDVIVGVQPKLEVDSSGVVIGDGEPTISGGDEESFALLHFYRNCSAHRDLIRFLPEKSWVEINQRTREIKLVRERQEQEGYFYYELDKGYWVHLPEAIARPEGNGHESRLLLEVLHQLISFVTKTTSKLLCSSLLLPSARVLLREHFSKCRTETKFKQTGGIQKAEVTVTTEHEEKVVVSSSGGHKLQAEAEEEACILIIPELAKRGILPNPPYSFLTLHHVQPYPPVQFLDKAPNKTYRMLMNEYGQRLERVGLKLKLNCIGPDPVTDREQHYSARVDLSMTRDGDGGEGVVRIFSGHHVAVGKDKAKEAAVAEVAEECIRLGLIQLK